jgi:tRNA 2-selenouridine synthase
MSSTTISDYQALFIHNIPLLDVRAPVEFARGAFPLAHNLPLMNDAERHQVGICYKEQGQNAAIAFGHKLVSGSVREQRIAAWQNFATQYPQGALYCFRGGLRSKISQQWLLEEAGIDFPRIQGGYKALRHFLLETLQQALEACQFTILAGLTGSGKTELLAQLPNGIDLEQHANHRGSSFGKRVTSQPSQIDFEHRIAIDVLQKRARHIEHFILEDEGLFIGRCALPQALHLRMQQLPVVWLEDDFGQRAKRILHDYVIMQSREYSAQYGNKAGFAMYAESLRQSLVNIRKRLGSERSLKLQSRLDEALKLQASHGEVAAHYSWIEPLLQQYFDPMYRYQQQRKAERIVFSGSHDEVTAYLKHNPTCP